MGFPLAVAFNPSDDNPLVSVGEPPEQATMESISDTVKYAASAMVALQEVLDRVDASVGRVHEDHEDRVAEARLGLLFIRAQEFTDRAMTRAREVLTAAEIEAAGIVAAAEDEATRLLREAEARQRDPVLLAQLQSSIEIFNKVNEELLDELSSMHRSLVQDPVLGMAQLPQPTMSTYNVAHLPRPDVFPVPPSHARQEGRLEVPHDPSSTEEPPTGAWMDDDSELWGAPIEYPEPTRRFWPRR